MLLRHKNLLSKVTSEREALTLKLPKIKLRVPHRFTKLVTIVFILLTFLGYYPTFQIPPIALSTAKATEIVETGEVIAKSFSKPLVLPHPGYLSTRFSPWHPGIDIATGLGMPIHSITEGTISLVSRDFFGLGNYVEVTHENGFKSQYAHMGRVYVKAGEKVTSENILGEVGLTGRTSGPHTHLEVTLNGSYIDPQTLLPEISPMPRDFILK